MYYMATCPFKNLFGAPRTGAHSLRFMDIAVVDTTLTIIAAAIIAHMMNKPFWLVLLFLFVVGEILHVLMCVDSTVALAIKRGARWITNGT